MLVFSFFKACEEMLTVAGQVIDPQQVFSPNVQKNERAMQCMGFIATLRK